MVVTFKAAIERFSDHGEKTGWTYIQVPVEVASKLKPGIKKSFRVKGKLDDYHFEQLSLVPMGGGNFILALNASIRKKIRKSLGSFVSVKMEADDRPLQAPGDFLECLAEEPDAMAAYNQLAKSHQNYFNNWIAAAKTDATKAKRIAHSINALNAGLHFGEMLRKIQQDRRDLLDRGLK
jgi:hypothetical protein